MVMLRSVALVLGIAVAMTFLFWGPLWFGAGFIGGDIYPYFLPQKTFLADRLHAGEFPLWNNLTGFGYPILGESQTGAAYPPYLLAYYLLDVNTAYNVVHIWHYIVCFFGMWLFCRRIGLTTSGSILAAIVFTYGWFPPRACLEWAIVTGSWMPVALWCVESFVQTRWWRYAIGLSFVLGLQLLAGHFHLAFVTQLLVVAYAATRIKATGGLTGDQDNTTAAAIGGRTPVALALLASVAGGFMLAALHLVPAWELKTRSSRATVGEDHDPSYGHLPPLYLSQMMAPWMWYSPDAIHGEDTIRTVSELAAPWNWFGPHRNLDESLMQSRAGGLTTVATNKVEAHLYCGLVPLGLAAWWLIAGLRRRPTFASRGNRRPANQTTAQSSGIANNTGPQDSPAPLQTESWFWGVAGIVAVVYATGWLLPAARFIPGFNFFRGPGRYGIVTTLAVAILAGRGLGKLTERRAGIGRAVILCCVFWSTVGDLWLVSRMVTYASMVRRPAITFRDRSPVRKLLMEQTAPPRLYAPMQNLGNLLGVSCLPVYLGIAPAEYADRKFAGKGLPKPDGNRPVLADEDFSGWLRESGVTHLLSEHPLDEDSWRCKLAWQGIDPMLNSAMGRSEPLYLYKLQEALGRASTFGTDRQPLESMVTVAPQSEANQFEVVTESPINAKLLVRELNYPGWQPEIDGRVVSGNSEGLFREVPIPSGEHRVTWHYRPLSVKLGLAISTITFLLLAGIGHVRFWHRQRLDRIIATISQRRQ